MKLSVILIGLVLACFGSLETAWSHVPPSDFILKTWAARHRRAQWLKIRSSVIGYEKGKPTGAQFQEVAYYDCASRTVWAVLRDSKGNSILSFSRGDDALSPVSKLLLYKDSQALGRSLQNAGIPVRLEEELELLENEDERIHAEISSLNRFHGTVSWVIGAKEDAQLWVEKDSFRPLRMFWKNESGRFSEVEMRDFRGEFPYPQLMRAREANQDLVLESRLEEIEEITELKFKSGIRPIHTQLEEPKEVDLSGDMQALVNLYLGKIR